VLLDRTKSCVVGMFVLAVYLCVYTIAWVLHGQSLAPLLVFRVRKKWARTELHASIRSYREFCIFASPAASPYPAPTQKCLQLWNRCSDFLCAVVLIYNEIPPPILQDQRVTETRVRLRSIPVTVCTTPCSGRLE
jgi:hypothetical protein